MIELFGISFDYTLQTVLLGSALIGIVAGVLGSFAVLKKQSLLGDAISHAALPGVVLAFLFTLSKDPLILLIGAIIAGVLGTLFVLLITKKTHLKEDAALGIVLSVFFGFGLFLLTIVQRHPSAKKAGLNSFLFGNASTLLQSEVFVMFIFGLFALICVSLFWKEFKILSFDTNYAKSLGFPTTLIEIGLTLLLVIGIAIGLQTVGVVLMSALVIAPSVAARQWSDKLGVMIGIAALIGALSGSIGAITSSLISRMPTGPTIVVVMSLFVVFSLFFSPHRGLIKDFVKRKKYQNTISVRQALLDMYTLAKSHDDGTHPHHFSSVRAIRPMTSRKSFVALEQLGFVKRIASSTWCLTPMGIIESKRIEKEDRGDEQ